MEIKVIVLYLLGIAFVCALYIWIRNDRVYKFQKMLCDCAFHVIEDFLASLKDDEELKSRYDEYTKINTMIDRIVNKSYDKMLYSFKPLKLEYWLDKEEIEFINKGRNNYGNNKVFM